MFGGKAYAVFALLFGFSFFIQDNNQRMRGNDFRLRFCWRLILLFILGNINAAFFTAEVLVLYSLVGFILPLTCRLKDKWLFILACVLLIQPLPLFYVIHACVTPSFVTPSIPTGSYWGRVTVPLRVNYSCLSGYSSVHRLGIMLKLSPVPVRRRSCSKGP